MLTKPKCHITLDPNKQYEQYAKSWFIEQVGIIWLWATAWEGKGSLITHIQDSYGMGELYQFSDKGHVQEDNSYTFPGDPILHPLAIIEIGDIDKIICYPHAIIAICSGDDNPFITRVD